MTRRGGVKRDGGVTEGGGVAERGGVTKGGGAVGSETVLEVTAIETFYGKSHILHGVSLSVRRGELVLVLGRNGAGKTTTMRSIMGLTPARRGRVSLFGEDSTRLPPYQVAARGVGYVPEGRRIFPHLTVEENLLLSVGKRPGVWDLAAVYQLFPRLEERRRHGGRQLSGGEQEMLAIARALLLNPKLLVLDEPSQGLAPLVVKLVMDTLQKFRSTGESILLVEQNAHIALPVADRVYVLDDGRVTYDGDAATLRDDPDRVRALTGVGSRTRAARS